MYYKTCSQEQVFIDSDTRARKLPVVDQPETTPKRVPPDSEALGLVQRCRDAGSEGVAKACGTESASSSRPYVAGQVICANVVVRRTRKETREYEIR